jgi:hypothetical protein
LDNFVPNEGEFELSEEIRNILAARELRTMPPLTVSTIELVRDLVEASKTDFIFLDPPTVVPHSDRYLLSAALARESLPI